MFKLYFLFISIVSARGFPKFPENFIFGVSTSAYQIEGAWNVSGKGENQWDHRTHFQPETIQDGSTGDIACDSYHKIKEDIQILRDLGVDAYRFSLSWSRILPTGNPNKINPDGIRYYNELINELLRYKIKPMVTIYHFDLPYGFHQLGGWTNSIIADIFVKYAKIAFENFGDRVKIWGTLNEPHMFCKMYEDISANAIYYCMKNTLIAHAKAYHLYKKEFGYQKGIVGIALDSDMYYPLTKSVEDENAARREIEFRFDSYAHPIFSKTGDFPPFFKESLANISKLENYEQSKLPSFTPDEIKEIKGSADFLGFNHYSSSLISAGNFKINDPESYRKDLNNTHQFHPSWEVSDIGWGVYPKGFYDFLVYIKERYNNPKIFVTENGYTESAIMDYGRTQYYKNYLQMLSEAVRDGVNVVGYYAWSLMDNFEWGRGYLYQFGLYHVNFTDPERTRVPKLSAKWFTEMIEHHKAQRNF